MTDISAQAIEVHLLRHVIGQDKAVRRFAVAVSNHLYAQLYKGSVRIEKANILLVGSTGAGKTHMIRQLSGYLGVPWVQFAAPSITQAGFTGFDPDYPIKKLIQKFGKDQAAKGIVYFDEIDKIARRSSDDGDKAANLSTGVGVQQALLDVIDASTIEIAGAGSFDASGVLFIFSGAFVGLERIILNRLAAGATARRMAVSEGELIAQVMPSDLVSFGMIPEFVGRCPVLIPLRSLGEHEIIRILTEPKHSLVAQAQARASVRGAELRFDPAFFNLIAREAVAQRTGARGLKNALEQSLTEAYLAMDQGVVVTVGPSGEIDVQRPASGSTATDAARAAGPLSPPPGIEQRSPAVA